MSCRKSLRKVTAHIGSYSILLNKDFKYFSIDIHAFFWYRNKSRGLLALGFSFGCSYVTHNTIAAEFKVEDLTYCWNSLHVMHMFSKPLLWHLRHTPAKFWIFSLLRLNLGVVLTESYQAVNAVLKDLTLASDHHSNGRKLLAAVVQCPINNFSCKWTLQLFKCIKESIC